MDTRILATIKYIEQNVTEQVELEAMAAQAGLSKFYFERLFQAAVGESFYAYFKRVKMHNAASRLKWTNQSIYEIAIGYGYSSNAAFTRAFRAFFGVSPTAYRADNASWDPEAFHKERNGGLSFDIPPKIQVREIGAYRCTFRRYYGPYETLQNSWRDFLERLPDALRGGEEGGARFLGRVYDDPRVTPSDQIRYDCCYVFADTEDARLQLDEVKDRLVTTDPGLYAVVDNNREPRPRPEIYAFVLDKWMPKTNYRYSDVPALEFFATCPVDANRTWSPPCTMLVPLE
jgi:AraC family transcriptional regulator